MEGRLPPGEHVTTDAFEPPSHPPTSSRCLHHAASRRIGLRHSARGALVMLRQSMRRSWVPHALCRADVWP
eukprot:scaffold26606_cov124-Isochrysis_galbana.AAC.10